MRPLCKSCSYWVIDEKCKMLEGECHLSPPQIILTVVDKTKGECEYTSQFVRTFGDMWCAQHNKEQECDRD